MLSIIEQPLYSGQYIKEPTRKDQIYLHHTVSSSGKNVDDWFNSTPERVGVPYVIEKDGTIYKLFDPVYWAFHIGKGSYEHHNKRSIGIEIVNEGYLEKVNNKYYWNGLTNNPKYEYKGDVFEAKEYWRGKKYFAAYTKPQINTLIELVYTLTKQFNIPMIVNSHYNYEPSMMSSYKGILSHCNVRKDKTDIHPGLDLNLFQSELIKFAKIQENKR